MEVLVVDWRPREFAGTVERFPQLTFHLTESIAEAEPYLATANVLVTVGRGLTPEVVDRMPALQWMQCLITGVNGALAALTGRPEVLLTSARGIHGPQMAEAALFHMLCLARDVRRSQQAQRERRWDTWDPYVLDAKTVGIVGIGVVGEHLAGVCKALGMTVLGVSRTARAIDGIDRIFAREDLAAAAAEVDFLVLTVPLSAETERMIDARVLAAMKPTAYLVNLARGGVVDSEALIAALRAGSIAGAGLDAFEEEPLPESSPFWSLENVFVTAHMGGRSDRYVQEVLTIFEPNLSHWLAGEHDQMRNVVAR
ncbi:MAG TPA: D-2-hydroxyacid dehydrogenase [Solirubrobacteraceae bacterium]|nr:D-2-hydroxyacid dehydrogenase [Solirubrobacteraceae bacterium]